MNRIKKTSVNIICLFIWHRPTRHRVHDRLNNFHIATITNYLRYIFTPVRRNSILITELNNCHGEVIGGIIPYLQTIGYNIDILINSETLKELPFCRQNMDGVRIYKIINWQRPFIHARKTRKYKHILVMTSANYLIRKPDGGYGCMLSLFRKAKLCPVAIEHDLGDIDEFGEHDLLRENRLITLGKFDRGIYVNPHLFGEVCHSPKNHVTTFIVVGNIEAKRKNFSLLTTALEKLTAAKAEFKVIIVGRGEINDLPAAARDHVKIMGRLNFPKLFENLEAADFFLTLLDPENPDHNRYLTTGVTGSAQMIYGFAKIPIVHQKFASFYKFNDENAIIYDGDLAAAMLQAIEITPETYSKMQLSLKHTATGIKKESQANLKRILNEK